MQVSSINSAADARRLMAMADPTSQAGGQAGATSKQIHAAAQQFEALILRQLLEPAMEPLMSGGLGGEQGGEFALVNGIAQVTDIKLLAQFECSSVRM